MDKTISVENLTKKFGDFTAVDGIDFHVARGEIFGFLGPNGAGKTTTIRMLCGLLAPTLGSGTVAGHDINAAPEEIKKVIGYMSQKFSLYQDLTVRENLEFFCGVYGVPRERIGGKIAETLRNAGLAGKENEITFSLAGGFKQKLALGCSLVHSPRILFLDEPTAGVDPISRKSFWHFIYALSEAGVTVVVTTHYMDEAEHCNRLALMYEGRIIAMGHPDELKQKEIKADLIEIECEPAVEGLNILRRDLRGLEVSLHGSSLHILLDRPDTRPDDIARMLAAGGVRVGRSEMVPPTLEDLFITLIERKLRSKAN